MFSITGDPATVVLVHWGDPLVEFQDIQEIICQLRIYAYDDNEELFDLAGVGVCECRVPSEPADAFKNALVEAFRRNPEIQVLYLAAHGGDRGLVYATGAEAVVSYGEISQIIRENSEDDALQVVFGSCNAMGVQPKIESLFPSQVYEVVGYWDKPTGPEAAALMASVLIDQVRLFRELQNTSMATMVQVNETAQNNESEVVAIIRAVLDQHTDNYTETVVPDSGRFIVRAVRDPVSGAWSRRVHVLRGDRPQA
jgi:hypothetical protein